MNSYAALNQQTFTSGRYSLVPIRFEDRMQIMQWRNEQIYHLRQNKPLTADDQELYFKSVIYPQFSEEQPKQILFSFLEDGICIGYGGLVHINWIDKNAEISFVMNTAIEKNNFGFYWTAYLKILETVAFQELKFHKIYTYAYNLRLGLFKTLESNNYILEAILKEHCLYEGQFIDVLIHSKINNE